MNFLAHTALSGGEYNGILVGNFMADSIRGNYTGKYASQPDIIKGIQLHRKIDKFTDQHVMVKKSIKRLRHNYGRYASVIVDIFYDHLLANNWDTYYDISLKDHSEKVYETLNAYKHKLPENIQKFLPGMIHNNWLVNYGTMQGIERSLESVSRRAKFSNKMDKSVLELKKDYNQFNKEFNQFYPYVSEFVRRDLAGEL